MCGIAGVLYFDKQKLVDEQRLTKARDAMQYRGPDSGGTFVKGNIGLAHRRLSILDLSANGNQPMHSHTGRYTIVFNGEIYNFLDLRKVLEQKGFSFKSHCDTEILLTMFEVYGVDMLDQLSGMFAFFIWDHQIKQLFMARDRTGMKPLCYSFFDGGLVFASEAKVLFTYGVPFEIDENDFNEMLVYRHVSGEGTLFKNIKNLLPGHYMLVDENRNSLIKRWWHLGDKIRSHEEIKNPLEWFTNSFDASVKRHLIADVPVGILLSGGLDSSSIAASLYKQGYSGIETFNMGFKNFVDDESSVAKNLSNHFKFPFHGLYLEDDELVQSIGIANITNDVPIMHQNEPHIVAISRYAKKYITVLLSGEGSDEFLGGYVRYKPMKYLAHHKLISLLLRVTPGSMKNKRINKLQQYFGMNSKEQIMFSNAINFYPNDFKKIGAELVDINNSFRKKILIEAQELYPNNYRRQMMYLDQHTYLYTLNDRNDRATMAGSVECRMPFLDPDLIEGLGTLKDKWFFTGKRSKFILKEAYKSVLTSEVSNFRKIGFSVPWLDIIFNNSYLKSEWDKMEQSEILQIGMLKMVNINTLKKQQLKANNPSLDLLLRNFFFMALWWKDYRNAFILNQSPN